MRPTAYAWYVIAVLSTVTLFSQLDRHFPSLLVAPLKDRFAITDTQFSLLHGYAFALTYAVMGVPFGRIVDRANRRNLIVAGLLIWSVLTVMGAFAQNFPQLIAARMGVGIGEAVLAPAAYSIIADYFAPERRGRAMAVYYTSLAVGSGIAMIAGGAMLRAIPATGIGIPGLGHLETWQAMFLLAGLPGTVLVWILLTIREPVRQEVGSSDKTASFGDFLRYIAQHSGIFLRVIGAAGLFTIVGYGVLGWAPALFERRFDIPPGQSALFIGASMMLGGTVGPLFAGWLSDLLVKRGKQAARMWPLIMGAFMLVPATAWAIMPTVGLAIMLLTVAILSMGMIQASIPVILQDLMPNRMRGQAIALYLLVASLVGIGFGPMAVGLMTDYVFGSDAMLPWSIASMAIPAALVGSWLSWRAIKPYERLKRTRSITSPVESRA